MNYHIESEGRIIASFIHFSDREYCLAEMRERYGDCLFVGINN